MWDENGITPTHTHTHKKKKKKKKKKKMTLQCYCDGSNICSLGGSVGKNKITWIPYVTFIQVSRVNARVENSNF